MKRVLGLLIIGFVFISGCSKKQYPTKENAISQTEPDLPVESAQPEFKETENKSTIKYLRIEPEGETDANYLKAYEGIKKMLDGREKLEFKKAVFLTENAFYGNKLNYESFNSEIIELVNICKLWGKANEKKLKYEFHDFNKVLTNWAIYTLFTDTIWVSKGFPLHYPYSYDFEDYLGEKDWSNMFVNNLLVKGKGNCHSLPYLYKILAEEIGTNAHLAFAPNHIYIKHKNKQIGMYNTELTSGEFPIDAWIACSGYILTDAMISQIYMDTLSLEESAAYTLVDLAQGYEKKFGKKDGIFILNCVNATLKYFPNSINALLLKAETQKYQLEKIMSKINISNPAEIANHPEIAYLFNDMERTYAQIARSGYREMPKEMYLDWLASLKTEQEKYKNRKISNIFNSTKPNEHE